MQENDIRPESLHKEQQRAFQHDIDRLLKHKDEFDYVGCPSCGSEGAYIGFYKQELHYSECRKCDTIYINPRPTPELLEDYYKNSEHYRYWASKIYPKTEKARRENIIKPRAKEVVRIAQKYKNSKGLLDIGAGYGTFCEEVQKLNWFKTVWAMEPTPELAEICARTKLLNTYKLRIEEAHISGFSVITAFEVIEHLFNPSELIKKCHKGLVKNGLLILTCPNAKGFDMSVLGEKSESFNPEHLNYFNPKSLSLLVESNGFEVLEISTPGKLDVELVKKQAKKGDLHPFMWELVNLGDKFQQFLVENKLSSHLWLVARKK